MRRSRVRSPSAPFPEQAKAAAARRTVLFCFLVALCEGLDLQAAGVAAGGLSREFMPTAGQKGLFFSASTFGLYRCGDWRLACRPNWAQESADCSHRHFLAPN